MLTDLLQNRPYILPAVIGTAALWIIFLILMLRSRARLRNCFLFLLALVATVLLIGVVTNEKYPGILVGELVVIGFALLVVPFFLMVNGIEMMKKEGRSIKHGLPLLLGIVILLGEVLIVLTVLMISSGTGVPTVWIILCLLGGLSIFYGSLMFLSFVLHSGNNYGVVAASYDGILIHQEVPSEGALRTLSLTFGFFHYILSFTKITCVVVIA